MLKITLMFVSGKNLLWTIQRLCQKNVKLILKLHQSRWKLKLRLKLGIKVSCWCWGNVLDSNQIVCQDSGQHHSWLQSCRGKIATKIGQNNDKKCFRYFNCKISKYLLQILIKFSTAPLLQLSHDNKILQIFSIFT